MTIWAPPVQQHDSKMTSINSQQYPKSIRKITINSGERWLDIGGGKFDNVADYFKSLGATLYIYDPFNRSPAFNQLSVEATQSGQCDGVMVNNVLNVVAEPHNRLQIIQQAYDALKPGASAHFLIYEGKKDAVGAVTKKSTNSSSYQMNQKAQYYIDEIKSIFPNCTLKGTLITAERKNELNIEKLKLAAKELGLVRHQTVGKKIGGSLYIHRQYSDVLPPEVLEKALLKLHYLRPNFDYTIIKYSKDSISFIECPDFDTSDEPQVGDSVKISDKPFVTKMKRDPQIYHHKWLFVRDDYQGFDVAASIRRSLDWKTKLGENRAVSSRIGTSSYWKSWVSKFDLDK